MIEGFRTLQREVHTLAREKGFYTPPRSDLESLALVASEVFESIAAVKSDKLAEELADIVLRVMDYAEFKQLDLAAAILNKHQFNKTRPYKHGK